MPFTDHIIIYDGTDTKWYKTSSKTWKYRPDNPSTARVLQNGDIDITYGNANLKQWDGQIIAPYTSPGGSWGTISTLRTQLDRKVAYDFTDHYGQTYYDCAIQGSFDEDSIMPDWEADDNEILIRIRVIAT